MSIDISLIVPTYNRRERLRLCLSSLLNQDYPSDNFEIIVVDDGSDYDVRQAMGPSESAAVNVRYLIQRRKGPASARNAGIRAAVGDIVALVDDDCIVNADWVRSMVHEHQRNPHAAAVGGLTLCEEKPSSMVSQELSTASITTSIGDRREVIFFPTCNVSFKKEVFKEFLFNEHFLYAGGEDLELFWRLFKKGHRLVWSKDIKVMHLRDDSLRSFIKQAYIYGRGNLLVQRVHRDHPLLKELKTGKISFWLSCIINALKIPRFSYLFGKRLIENAKIRRIDKQISIYAFLAVHKLFYILGTIAEFRRIANQGLFAKESGAHIPASLIVDITHSCNLSCRICDIWKTAKNERDLDLSLIQKILFQAKNLGIKEIALSGGEPLLRKDIYDILDYARKIKIKHLGILSNGITLYEQRARLKPYIIDNTVSAVISLDSLQQETHNFIRNSCCAWQNTIAALKELSSLKREYPSVNFHVISIIFDQNLDTFFELAAYIKSLGADSWQIQPLLSNNLSMAERSKSLFWIPESRLRTLDHTIDRLIELKNTCPDFIKNSANNLLLIKKYYRNLITPKMVKCASAYDTFLVSNQGMYTTCFSRYGDPKNDTIESIIRGEKIIEARRKVAQCLSPCLLPCFCDR